MFTALDKIRREAREAHAQQHYSVAEQHYRTLLKAEASPDDVINLGALLRSQGRLKEGSHFYRQWINHFGSDERILLNACNCWNENNEAHLVLQFLENLFREDKLTLRLKFCLTDALHRLGRFEECTTILQQSLSGRTSDKEIWVRIGLAHAKNQDLSAALDAFTKASQMDPGDLEMVSNRITILKDLGHFDKAELLIKELSSDQQLQADVAQATAGLLMAQNKLVEATSLFQRVCQQRPSIASYWLNWAAALRGLCEPSALFHSKAWPLSRT